MHVVILTFCLASRGNKMTSYQTRKGFWHEAVALEGAVTLKVIPSVLIFGILSSVVCGAASFIKDHFQVSFELDISVFGFAGVALGILLVIRLNAGYDRWWEARTLWGGIVNQSRNLIISSITYGPENKTWRDNMVRWTAAFPHVARHTLRSEPLSDEVINLIGPDAASNLTASGHMPSTVAMQIGELLQTATKQGELDGFAFMQIDRERALLIDHLGACERIVLTPLPQIYSLKIRHFILLFLLLLPVAMIPQLNTIWWIPILTMLIAYPLLSLDQIGVELENPFSTANHSHLPLNDISATIERNLLSFLHLKQ